METVQLLESMPASARRVRRKGIDLGEKRRECRYVLIDILMDWPGGKKVLENHFSGHKRETKELMEAAEIPSLGRCSVFTAINSTVGRIRPRSNAACYNLFKLAPGLFMKKLRRR